VVEGVRAFARGRLSRGYLEPLGWQGLRTFYLDPGFVGDVFDFFGKPLQLLKVRAGELDAGVLRHLLFGWRFAHLYLDVFPFRKDIIREWFVRAG